MLLSEVLNTSKYNLESNALVESCKATLEQEGAIVLPDFLTEQAIRAIVDEGKEKKSLAWYTSNTHNVYLTDIDSDYALGHVKNKQVNSSKGCITDDQISQNSPLRVIYDAASFRTFLTQVLGIKALHEYADPLSSINLHYASAGQELGWHFDNSSFAITLLIQKPQQGGSFEYLNNMRDADRGEMNFEGVEQVLAGNKEVKSLTIEPGSLVLFRGRNAIHRVTPTIGDRTRMLVVLAYNSEPDVALSESARMTFFGRLA
jgi:hypothetical protein